MSSPERERTPNERIAKESQLKSDNGNEIYQFVLASLVEKDALLAEKQARIEELERDIQLARGFSSDLTKTITKQKEEIARLREALLEIQEMFDGEADIDNHGNPNRAMSIDSIVEKAINSPNSEGR